MVIPTGGVAVGGWERPFSRLAAGDNGLPYDDRGANGSVRLRDEWTWTKGADNSTGASWWIGGSYAHPDYHGNSALNPDLTSSDFDGHDFYIQMRVKVTASRFQADNPPGKFWFVSTMRKSNPRQELVIQSLPIASWQGSGGSEGAKGSIYRMYTNNGNQFNSFLTDPQGSPSGASMQPNGKYASTCTIGNNNAACWEWPPGEWVTILMHVIPGHQTVTRTLADPVNDVARDTGIEVWAARMGETTYTKIWQKLDYLWEFGGASTSAYREDSAGEGFNGLLLSGYMNNVPAELGWSQMWDQVIFSKEFIPCPQA
jgi:hypothetical protein